LRFPIIVTTGILRTQVYPPAKGGRVNLIIRDCLMKLYGSQVFIEARECARGKACVIPGMR